MCPVKALQTVRVTAALAIPLGHRVEVRWYGYEQSNFFSTTPELRELAAPWIVDLDTGVEYSHGEHHEASGAVTSGRVKEVPLELLPTLKLRSQLRGSVRRCLVMTLGSGQYAYPQTTLLIEPE